MTLNRREITIEAKLQHFEHDHIHIRIGDFGGEPHININLLQESIQMSLEDFDRVADEVARYKRIIIEMED